MRTKRVFTLIVAFVAVLVVPVLAQADITDLFDLSGKLNTVDYINREVFTDQDGNVISAADVEVGSYLISVFKAQNLFIDGSGDDAAWTSSAGDYFFGYAVQEVATINDSGLVVIGYQNPTSDPFGVLDVANGETLQLYTSQTDWVVDSGTLAASIASATAGDMWGNFSIGENDYATTVVLGETDAVGSFGLTNMSNADGIQFLPYSPSNSKDPTDISGTAVIQRNSNGPLVAGDSPWEFESFGPMEFTAVPEPGTLAMWGAFLSIGALIAVRRRK